MAQVILANREHSPCLVQWRADGNHTGPDASAEMARFFLHP